MHAILGAGGAIGESLSHILAEHNVATRQVSRHSRHYNHGTDFRADITKADGALKAVEGAEVAYMVVGLPYKLPVWQSTWPSMMDHVVNACAKTGTKLIFLDNIYMLSDASTPRMTESSPMNPSSKKGAIRKQVDQILLDAMDGGRVNACIVRSADFYGYTSPHKSLLLDLVIRRMTHGKSPQWFYTIDKKHSFSYIPDVASALFMLAGSEKSWGQVWNVPTAPAMTLSTIIDMMNHLLHKKLKPQVLGNFMTSALGLFVPALTEMKELKYQLVQDYVLDSSKFEQAFSFEPTSMEEGLETVIDHIHKSG
ncbi:MAG: NAD-dependent epimerase/dehydratase family protein [Chitinophagaceae bacterium]|jgi:nucleoside-diphosphate-sugar epimerase|nr:NAD-dependent epimerase/dehydratase family protein [Chitinophagaceae bacterium]